MKKRRARQDQEPECRLRWERGSTWVPAVEAADPSEPVSPLLLGLTLATLAAAFALALLTR